MEQLLSTPKISPRLCLPQDYNREKVFAMGFPLCNAQNQTQKELLKKAILGQ